MKFTVIGAGMAGLLAAGMLRKECSKVLEAQKSLPNNHSAVLRFRTSSVGDNLNIRFKEVQAIKSVHPWRNPIADAMSYSLKTNGTATLRSVLTASSAPVIRYIAPPDMVQQMYDRVSNLVQFGAKLDKEVLESAMENGEKIISTIPMPALMGILGWPNADDVSAFRSIPGVNYGTCLKGVNAYCSLYVPNPDTEFSRLSLTGDELVAEVYGSGPRLDTSPELILKEAIRYLGLKKSSLPDEKDFWVKKQRYAKILPIDESTRREFIMWASRELGVYSLGRYATWRPGLLLDDLVNDVRVIQKIATKQGTVYSHQLKGN